MVILLLQIFSFIFSYYYSSNISLFYKRELPIIDLPPPSVTITKY